MTGPFSGSTVITQLENIPLVSQQCAGLGSSLLAAAAGSSNPVVLRLVLPGNDLLKPKMQP